MWYMAFLSSWELSCFPKFLCNNEKMTLLTHYPTFVILRRETKLKDLYIRAKTLLGPYFPLKFWFQTQPVKLGAYWLRAVESLNLESRMRPGKK